MARSEEESSSATTLVVGCLLLVVVLFGGAFFLGTSRGSHTGTITAVISSAPPSGLLGTRYTNHADGSVAEFEVQLTFDGRSVVRRAFWSTAGVLDEERSGLFVDGARTRRLTADEATALADMSKLPSREISDSLPTVLLADG